MANHERSSHEGLGLSETRRTILHIVKRDGGASIAEIAQELRVSYETVRLQVGQMRAEGWLEPQVERRADASQASPTAGRPLSRYYLTVAGEHLFPKHYDVLSVALIDAVIDRLGVEALAQILQNLTEARVRQWEPVLEGMTLEQKIEALKGIYLEEDPFTSFEKGETGELRLVERNCPFLNVALERPALCSLTVSTLTRLLGFRVVREKRFQAGDGRCVFRVLTDRPIGPDPPPFAFEQPLDEDAADG
jgi:predicted ArsR family transcriptional regulator